MVEVQLHQDVPLSGMIICMVCTVYIECIMKTQFKSEKYMPCRLTCVDASQVTSGLRLIGLP